MKNSLLWLLVVFFCVGCSKKKGDLSAPVEPSRDPVPMVTLWEITEAEPKLQLPLVRGFEYDFVVDWGDDTEPSQVKSYNDPGASHVYVTPGTYEVVIEGVLPAWSFRPELLSARNVRVDSPEHKLLKGYKSSACGERLLEVQNLGSLGWRNLSGAFWGCKALRLLWLEDLTSTAAVDSMQGLLAHVQGMGLETNLGRWDTSNVRNMRFMFLNTLFVDVDIKNFNTAQVRDFSFMFYGSDEMSPNVVSWDVSRAEYMQYMFAGASLAEPHVETWDVASVKNFDSMFAGATKANPGVGAWDFTSAKELRCMVSGSGINAQNKDEFHQRLKRDFSRQFTRYQKSLKNCPHGS